MSIEPYQGGGAIEVGQTNMGAGDFVPPRVKIAQQMSQEVADKIATAGDFFNTLTRETYGSKITFVPILNFMQRVFITRLGERKDRADNLLLAAGEEALPEGDGLMCRSLDMVHGIGDPGILCAQCPLSQWEGRTVAPLCSETYNLAALTERGDVIFLGFSRSSAKVGKRVNSILRLQSGAPSGRNHPWDRLWEATTLQDKNDKGVFFVPDVRQTSDTTPPELAKDAAYWASQLRGIQLDVEVEEEPVEDVPAGEPPF